MKSKLKSIAMMTLAAALSTPQLGTALPVMADETPQRQELLPQPAQITYGDAWYNMGATYALSGEDTADAIAVQTLKTALSSMGMELTTAEDADTLIMLAEDDDQLERLTTYLAGYQLDAAGLKADSYVLAVSEAEGQTVVGIEGTDERGTFYGVQTLIQMIADQNGSLWIEEAAVEDEPAMTTRGSIEGFYAHVSQGGVEWTWAQRREQVKFYGQTKMNTYIYAPKDDPYHRTQWREAYPEDQMAELAATVQAAIDNHVDFVFALSPGNDIALSGTNAESDFSKLVEKCEAMYEVGVRRFAIFFDDISLTTNAGVLQAQLLNRFNEEFVKAKGDVASLITVPTQYDSLAMRDGTALSSYTTSFSQTLDDDIVVLWTGAAVVPDGISQADGEFVTSVYGDRVGVWWNYPCNDYQLSKLGLGPIYSVDPALTQMMDTFVMNPMGQAELSKITLGTGAEYAWSGLQYDDQVSYEKTMNFLFGDLAEDMMTFAKHSTRLSAASFSSGRLDAPDVKVLMTEALSEAAAADDFTQTEVYNKLMSEFNAMISAADHLQANLNAEMLQHCTAHLDKLRQVGQYDIQALELLAAKVAEDSDTVSSLTSALNGVASTLKTGKLISENTGVQFITDVLDYQIQPTAGFTLDKSLVLPGEAIQLNNASSSSAAEFEWKFPGAVVTTSNEKNPTVTYEKEGIYTIQLTASNRFGQDVVVNEQCVVVSKNASQDIVNLALNKPATAISSTGSAESPDKAVDGLDTSKWCSTYYGTKWLQIDLEEERSITGFTVKHASVGGEGSGLNTKAFSIQTSLDGTNWTDVVVVTNNTEGETNHTIPMTNARYVKLVVTTPTQGSDRAARIFEFEVYGTETPIEVPAVYASASKELLQTAVSYANAQKNLSTYETVNALVKARFEEALSAAQDVLDDPAADEQEVWNAWVNLTEMIHYLGFTSDKTELEQVILEAEVIFDQLDQYEGDLDEFVEALENARSVFDSETALDDTIQDAIDRLKDAMDGISKKVVELNKALLEYLVSVCEPVVDDLADKYVEAGQAEFLVALENGKTALETAQTQEEIDTALQELSTAWMNLRLKADESILASLKDFVAMVDTMDFSTFSAEQKEQIVSLRDTVADALALHEQKNPELTQIAAEALMAQVEDVKALVADNTVNAPVPVTPSTTPATAPAGTKDSTTVSSVKTSTTTHAGMFGAICAAGLGALALLGKKRRK